MNGSELKKYMAALNRKSIESLGIIKNKHNYVPLYNQETMFNERERESHIRS